MSKRVDLATAVAIALASAAAQAQNTDNDKQAAPQQLPKVSVQAEEPSYKADTVSSPKFTQPLVDIPQTITVIKKELIQDQAATTLSEALSNSPGITFQLGENGNTTTGDSVFMRGFDTSGSIFLDGIRDLGTVTRDVFNLEQIEVVKGPSGSDNGRGTPTGYINLSTKMPLLEDARFMSTGIGNDNRLRVTGDLNEAFDAGLPGSALRLNVMYEQSDKLGRDVAENERLGFAPSFALGLGTSTRAHFNYLFVKQDNIPDGGIPAIGLADYNLAALLGTVPAPVDRSNYYGALNDSDQVEANILTIWLEHDFSEQTTLRNTSRYGRLTQDLRVTGVNAITIPVLADPSTWTVARNRHGKDQLNEVLTNQTNVTTAFDTGFIGHSLSAGVEFLYEHQSSVTYAGSGTTAPANLYNPSTADPMAPIVPTGAINDGKTTTGALYVFDTLKFNEQWALNAGLRFERFQSDFSGTPATATPPGATTRLEGSDNLLTGKLGLVYKPLPNGSVYAAYATSEQPPGSTNFTLNAAATNINNPNLDPQEARNIELGTKWELLDNQLVVTGAVFDTRNKNDQAISDPVTGEVDQYGERKVRGIELGASGMITPNWQISLGLAKMDTEVTEANVGQPGQQGAAFNFSPELTFTSWTTYQLPLGLTLGAGARFVDSQITGISNDPVTLTNLQRISSYWVFDVMAGYPVTERIGLQLNVRNVSDEFYLASVNNGRSRYTLGAPRSALLTVNVTF